MLVFFFIMFLVMYMRVYIDIIIIVNFIFDFIILSSVNYLLKRNSSIIRLVLSSLIGELSIITLLLPLSNISLLLSKLLISIFMLLIAFKYEDIENFKKNFIYFYIISIVLGGIIYFIKLSLNINNDNLLYNIVILLLVSPYLIYKYVKENKKYKNNINLVHDIDIYIDSKKYSYKGYIDTGNVVKDPYKRRSIILINDNKINFCYEKSILVPFETLNNSGVIKCIKPDKVILDNKIEINNILVGESKSNFNIDSAKALLPNVIKEEYL